MDQDRQKARELARELPLGERIKHYLGYYKIHIIVGIILIIALALFIRSRILHKDSVYFFGLMNSNTIDVEYLESAMAEALELGEKETITCHKDLSSEPTGTYDYTSIYLAADELNIMFADATAVEYLYNSEAIAPLDYWYDASKYPNWKERIYELNGEGVALDISGTDFKEKLYLEEDINYIIVLAKPGREEYMYQFFDWLYEN